MKNNLRRFKRFFLKAPSFKSQYYKKHIVILLFVLCGTSLLIGSAIYLFGVRQLRDEMSQTHEEQIINQVEYIDSQMQSLEVNLSYWSHEKLFRHDLDKINFQEQYELARDVTNSLFSKKNGNSLIENISLFINSEEPAVFNPQFRWVEEERLNDYRHFLLNEEDFYWQVKSTNIDDHHLFPLVLVRNLPSYDIGKDENSASFIVELNQQAVLQMIDGLSLSSDGFSFFIDEKSGKVISSNEKSSQFFEEVVTADLLSAQSFSINWNGIDYSVSTGVINRVNSDWTYMSVVPISFITEPISQLSQTIVMISLVGLILSIVVANLTFRSIYQPIEKLMELFKGHTGAKTNEFNFIQSNWFKLNNEKEFLENHVDVLNEKLISNFFFQLIEGYLNDQTESELRARLRQYHVKFNHEKICYVDIELMNKKQQMVMSKMLESAFNLKSYLITFNEKFIGVIVIFDDDAELTKQLNEFYQKVKTMSEFDYVILYASPPVHNLKDLIRVVDELRHKKYINFKYKETKFIQLKPTTAMLADDQQGDLYPFNIERKLLIAIDHCDKAAAYEQLNQFITFICEQDERDIQYCIVQLYGQIQKQILKDGFHPFELFNGKNIIKDLNQIYDIDRLKHMLLEVVINPFITKRKEKTDNKYDQIVKKTLDYIHTHYMNDVSLDQCADELGLNASKLSKLFKQGKGINFIDYLTNYRIEQAKVLLVDTTMKIQDIAVAVGYRHSYFNRIFKKHSGMTPGQYREVGDTYQHLNSIMLNIEENDRP